MLSIITYKDVPEEIEIIADEIGIDDLIGYLQYIKKSKDHIHLTIDTELNSYPISSKMSQITKYAKSARIEYNDSSKWQ